MKTVSSFFASLAVAASTFGALGCSVGDAGATDESDLESQCGSALGDLVAKAAEGGKSTVSGAIDSRANRIVEGPFDGAEATIEAGARLIATAKHEVLIQAYSFEPNTWSFEMLASAIRALPSDVRVYILTNPAALADKLGRTDAKRFNAIKAAFADHPNVVLGQWDVHWLTGVLHSKSIVVDGARALVTDTNVERHVDPIAKGGDDWYQTGIVIEGAAARALRSDAVNAWGRTLQDGKGPTKDLALPEPNVDACTRITVLGRKEKAEKEASANRGYAAMFRGAKKTIRATSPNMNADEVMSALSEATQGADVYLLIPLGFNDSKEKLPLQGGTNDEAVTKLAKRVKNPCRLHVRWWTNTKGEVSRGNEALTTHAKWATADGQVTIVGSQNLDTQSWKNSRELNVAIDDAKVTSDFDALFEKAWQRAETIEGLAFECERGAP